MPMSNEVQLFVWLNDSTHPKLQTLNVETFKLAQSVVLSNLETMYCSCLDDIHD